MAHGTEDIFSFSAFDPMKLGERFRDIAGKGAGQSSEAYARMKVVTEEAAIAVESTVQSAQAGSVEIGLKAIDVFRSNADLSLSHMQALLDIKSASQFFELQTAFFRRQAEVTVEQARSMQDMARKLAEDVSRPGKEAAEKAMASFRSA
jgi:phasin